MEPNKLESKNELIELIELIEQFKDCSECLKTSNYPQDWLEDIKTRKAEIFANNTNKEDILPLVNEVHEEYSERFDAEGLEVKIPFDGSFYTLEEAEALLEEEEVNSYTLDEYKIQRAKVEKAKKYLKDTDFYMIFDKYETLSEEKRIELKTLRAEAREIINSL